jgi:hypothetical protein
MISYLLLLLLLLLLHVRDQMSVGFDFGTEWRRRRRRMLLLLLLMKNERRMMADDSSGSGGCSSNGALVAVNSVMFNIQLVAAAHRPGFQQGQTTMLIAAHQFLTRWMAFTFSFGNWFLFCCFSVRSMHPERTKAGHSQKSKR